MELPTSMVAVVAPHAARFLLERLPPGLPLTTLCPTGQAGFYGIFEKPRWFRPSLIALG